MIRNPLASLCVLVLAGSWCWSCGGAADNAPVAAQAGDLSAGTGGSAGARPARPVGGGSIRGVATFTGRDPDVPIALEGDPYCAAHHGSETMQTESVVLDAEHHLGNVVVQLRSGPLGGPYAPPATPAVLDQSGCHYEPHVLAIQVGQPLRIKNSDATLHNIHASAAANSSFNEGQPFPGMELTKTFTRAETAVPLRCSVHPWMLAWVAVIEHPFFAVTASDGSFEIAGLEPGSYTLEAWHETLGTQTSEVTVPAGGTAEIALTFAATAK